MSEPRADPLQAALTSLPHGPEFRFVEEILELTPGHSLRARLIPSKDAAYFAGHFPGRPLFPGVLMIEAIAQASGIAAQTDPARPPLSDLRLTAVLQMKILGATPPETPLFVETNITGRMGGLIQATGTVSTADRHILAKGSVALSGQES